MTVRARLGSTPAGYELTLGRVLAIYGGLMVALMLTALDQTVISTVLPRIVADLGGLSLYSWAFTSYMLTSAVTVPLYGKLGDHYGRRILFVFAISVFVVSSVLCALSQNMVELVVFRGLQGVGAGALFPLALATVGDIVPLRERGRYHGLLGAGFAAGSIAGPLAGGFIADHASWRWVFYLNVPLGASALALILATMPGRRPGRSHSIDWVGAAVLAAATTALLFAVVSGGAQYSWPSAPIVGSFVAAGLLAATFVIVERRVPEPILPFQYVRIKTVRASLVAIGLAAMAMYALLSYVPLFVETVIGTSATSSGIALMPLLVGDVFASFLTGQWIARTGRLRPTALVGPLAVTTGSLLLWRMNIATTTVRAALDMMVAGVGFGLMMQVFVMSVQNAVPLADIGSATALTQSARAMGSTFGVAIMGVMINQRLPGRFADALNGVNARSLPLDVRIALEHAIRPGFLVTACVAAAVFVTALVGISEVPLRRTLQDEPVQEAF